MVLLTFHTRLSQITHKKSYKIKFPRQEEDGKEVKSSSREREKREKEKSLQRQLFKRVVNFTLRSCLTLARRHSFIYNSFVLKYYYIIALYLCISVATRECDEKLEVRQGAREFVPPLLVGATRTLYTHRQFLAGKRDMTTTGRAPRINRIAQRRVSLARSSLVASACRPLRVFTGVLSRRVVDRDVESQRYLLRPTGKHTADVSAYAETLREGRDPHAAERSPAMDRRVLPRLGER